MKIHGLENTLNTSDFYTLWGYDNMKSPKVFAYIVLKSKTLTVVKCESTGRNFFLLSVFSYKAICTINRTKTGKKYN